MISDALELAAEGFASLVGWRARRKEAAAERAQVSEPQADGVPTDPATDGTGDAEERP